MKKQFTYYILLLTIFLTPQVISAIGLSVKPAELVLEGREGKEVLGHLTVSNPSNEVLLFEAYSDELESLIKVVPASFVLENDKKQLVLLKIKSKESGRFYANVSIVAKPLSESSFNAGSGVKIPLIINIQKKNSLFASLISTMSGLNVFYILLGCGMMVLCLKIKSKISKVKILNTKL